MSTGTEGPRVCVLLPTYNNSATLLDIIASVRLYIPDVIVINDGCTDETASLLDGLEGVEVVTHETNRGKGRAIVSGFERAVDLGFTSAITMDTDGQHDPDDLPLFLDAIEERPENLVIGTRDLSGEGRAAKSRKLRMNSNFWIWVVTGHWVADTQSGFRAYPLGSVSRMHFKTSRYDFEIEVLAFVLWNDLAIRSVPVKACYGPGSESHFRPIVDFLRVTRLNIHLIAERLLLNKAIRVTLHLARFREGSRTERFRRFVRTTLVQESVTPAQFSACIGLGVFCGILPLWGFQTALALGLSGLFKLSRTLTLLASNISIPITIPFILYASLFLGHVMLSGNTDLALSPGALPEDWKRIYAQEYLLGSVSLSCIGGVASACFSYAVVRLISISPQKANETR